MRVFSVRPRKPIHKTRSAAITPPAALFGKRPTCYSSFSSVWYIIRQSAEFVKRFCKFFRDFFKKAGKREKICARGLTFRGVSDIIITVDVGGKRIAVPCRPTRTISSVGQSHRLITGWSKVRALDGPPTNGGERIAFPAVCCPERARSGAGVNDSPVGCQSRDGDRAVTPSQRRRRDRALDGPPNQNNPNPKRLIVTRDWFGFVLYLKEIR